MSAFAGADDNKVYLFDKDSSTPLWSYVTGENVRTVAISADGVYITAGRPTLERCDVVDNERYGYNATVRLDAIDDPPSGFVPMRV